MFTVKRITEKINKPQREGMVMRTCRYIDREESRWGNGGAQTWG